MLHFWTVSGSPREREIISILQMARFKFWKFWNYNGACIYSFESMFFIIECMILVRIATHSENLTPISSRSTTSSTASLNYWSST